jgi:hypothetical protein
MSSLLAPQDRIAVINLIAQLRDFSDVRGRSLLLELANLGRFSASIDLSGPARTTATDLVLRLEKFGPLPEQPAAHALGALFIYVLSLSDLPRADAKLLAELIVKYSLVNDPTYIEKLRGEYGLNVVPVQAVKEVAPVRATAAAIEPAFTPQLTNQAGLETVINSEDNFLDIAILAGALYCAQAVCRIEEAGGKPLGTGVLVGPDLILTNQHVLKSKEYLEGTIARFDYKLIDGVGVPHPGRIFPFRTDFYESSPAEELDYALAKTAAAPLEHLLPERSLAAATIRELAAAGKHRGYLEAVSRFIKEGERVNIIQHPDGDPLKVVMTQNYVAADMGARRLQYVADTMPGSSGSPVFNSNWELVALHHSGTPYPPDSVGDTVKKAWKGRFRVNEGIPMRAILDDFKSRKFEQYLPAR